MFHQYLKVNPRLNAFVRSVLVMGNGVENSDLPLFTNGMPALICKTKNNDHHITLHAQSVPAEEWTMEENETLIAYFFKPFVLPSLFDLSAAKLKKSPVDLNNWNAHQTNALRIQLGFATCLEQKTEALDHLLLRQWQQNQKEYELIQKTTDRIMCCPDPEILSVLLKEFNLNERTFQRVFKKNVGISAGQFRRICQFQQTFSQLKSGRYQNLTELAYASGFSDQSHFIRSFKEFVQTTPNNYLKHGLEQKK